ncbi:MAG: N5-glutamine methyltransferase family protein [Anaerolineae bacterium]
MPDRCSTIKAALAWACTQLSAVGCATPTLDAEVLLAHTLQRNRAWLRAYLEHRLTDSQIEDFVTLVMRHCTYEPVAYLVGHKEFFGLDFAVTPAALVPRPETELLVEIALAHVTDKSKALWVADVGTGSGVLAITLAVHLPRAKVLATDISAQALLLAQDNARRHGVSERILFIQADLLPPVGILFDLVLANPPYLRSDELPTNSSVLNTDGSQGWRGLPACQGKREGFPSKETWGATLPLAWEPQIALNGGVDGLHVIRQLLTIMPPRLRSGGLFVMELGAAQGHTVSEIARMLFPRADISIRRDYAGLERAFVLIAP